MLDMFPSPLVDVSLQRPISPGRYVTQNGRVGLRRGKRGQEVSYSLVIPPVIDVALAAARHSNSVGRRLRKETEGRNVVMVGCINSTTIDT